MFCLTGRWIQVLLLLVARHRRQYREVVGELQHLYDFGVRYIHEHARNPSTREQSCATRLYSEFGRLCAASCPDAVLSFGASRNGPEIDAAVSVGGEWARIAHTTL